MPRVFICYRRDDSAPYAGRLHDRLASEFGSASIFIDLDSIGPGEKFDERICTALDRTDVLVAVIGEHWLSVLDDAGKPRIWFENDYARREIALALGSGVHVIPTLVGRAEFPTREKLPVDIQPIAALQAVELSDLRWSQDVGRLIAAIDRAAPWADGWIRSLRSQRSQRRILWILRVLMPLSMLVGLALVQKAERAGGEHNVSNGVDTANGWRRRSNVADRGESVRPRANQSLNRVKSQSVSQMHVIVRICPYEESL